MRVKTIVNGKGEPQATEIAIPIEFEFPHF